MILFHTKLSGYQEEVASITSLSFPHSTNPHLRCLHPAPTVGACWFPTTSKQQQSATNTTCYSSGFLASHPKISPQSCQLAVLLLPRKISATARVWPVFPTAIWSQRLSPARHESLTCNSVKTRSPHPPAHGCSVGFSESCNEEC